MMCGDVQATMSVRFNEFCHEIFVLQIHFSTKDGKICLTCAALPRCGTSYTRKFLCNEEVSLLSEHILFVFCAKTNKTYEKCISNIHCLITCR